jgi:hypothetical protein
MLPTIRKYKRQNNEVLPRKLLSQILEAFAIKLTNSGKQAASLLRLL